MTSRYGRFTVYYEADSEEEADEIFDRLTAAAEDICCGTDGTHECARQWTCGGETGPTGTGETKEEAEK